MLATLEGVGPSCVALPAGHWPCMIDFLVERFPAIPEQEWLDRMARGHVVDESGQRVSPRQPFVPMSRLFYYRSLPAEESIAPEAAILFEDELLVVADKPHFLPVVPSGRYLQETLLVRLRRQLGIDALTPLHRIDRETAGIVLFAKQEASRKNYHTLFANRQVGKVYQAIAPWRADLSFPLTRETVLVEGGHFMQMCELADASRAPNSHTTVEWLETRGALARYQLRPLTGKRHQLRVHMAALGMPIVGDRNYPALLPAGQDDPANPLRLLAQSIAFCDPLTGRERQFASQQALHFPA